MTEQITATRITIEHVTLPSPKSCAAVRSALEASVRTLDHAYAELLLDGKVDEARDRLERQAPLSIFGAGITAASTFGQFGNRAIDSVARALDDQLRTVVAQAAR